MIEDKLKDGAQEEISDELAAHLPLYRRPPPEDLESAVRELKLLNLQYSNLQSQLSALQLEIAVKSLRLSLFEPRHKSLDWEELVRL